MDGKSGNGTGYWTNLPALTHVERLEAACHQFTLHVGDDGAREALRAALHLDIGEGLDQASPAASFGKVAEEQMGCILALLDDTGAEDLLLRMAMAHLHQTLASLRSHLSGGRRTMAFGPRREV